MEDQRRDRVRELPADDGVDDHPRNRGLQRSTSTQHHRVAHAEHRRLVSPAAAARWSAPASERSSRSDRRPAPRSSGVVDVLVVAFKDRPEPVDRFLPGGVGVQLLLGVLVRDPVDLRAPRAARSARPVVRPMARSAINPATATPRVAKAPLARPPGGPELLHAALDRTRSDRDLDAPVGERGPTPRVNPEPEARTTASPAGVNPNVSSRSTVRVTAKIGKCQR